MQKGILYKQQNREGETTLSEQWKLPAKGSYPERTMSTFAFFNLETGTLERMTLNDDELKALKLTDQNGEIIEMIKMADVFTTNPIEEIKVIEVETSSVKKGKMTIETVIGLHVKEVLTFLN